MSTIYDIAGKYFFPKVDDNRVKDIFAVHANNAKLHENKQRFIQHYIGLTFKELFSLSMPVILGGYSLLKNIEDEDLRSAVINPNAATQRPDAEDEKKRQNIMRSIVKREGIGTITLRRIDSYFDHDGNQVFVESRANVIDGSHRVRTCAYYWYQNKLTLPVGSIYKNEYGHEQELAGHTYESLKKDHPLICEQMDNAVIPLTIHYNITDEEATDIFRALNTSTHSNEWEDINSIDNNVIMEKSRTLVRKVQGFKTTPHEFFTTSKVGEQKRCKDQAFALRVMKQVYEKNPSAVADASDIENDFLRHGKKINSTFSNNPKAWEMLEKDVEEHFNFMNNVLKEWS